MHSIGRKTRKIFYESPSQLKCNAKITKIGRDFVELDQTIAYPEGGGQDSDQGRLILPNGIALRFVHARKMYGLPAKMNECPDLLVGGVIEHVVHPDDCSKLESFSEGEDINVEIDFLRRRQLSLSHTASHLLYLAIKKVRPDVISHTLGCHISIESARFDFFTNERFSSDEVSEINRAANKLIPCGCEVNLRSHIDNDDIRYWELDGNVIPCGGTHIKYLDPIFELDIRRKSMGKGKERISCTFLKADFNRVVLA